MYVTRPRSKFPGGPRRGLNGIPVVSSRPLVTQMQGLGRLGRGLGRLARLGDDAIFVPSGDVPAPDPLLIAQELGARGQGIDNQIGAAIMNPIIANAPNSATLTDRTLWWLQSPMFPVAAPSIKWWMPATMVGFTTLALLLKRRR